MRRTTSHGFVHEGRLTRIVLNLLEFRDVSPELDRLLAEAVPLRDTGPEDDAYRMLNDLYLQGVPIRPQ